MPKPKTRELYTPVSLAGWPTKEQRDAADGIHTAALRAQEEAAKKAVRAAAAPDPTS